MSQNLEDGIAPLEDGFAAQQAGGAPPALEVSPTPVASTREFNIGLTLLQLVRGFALAAFLSRADYGVFGVLGVTLGLLARLKVVGIGEKYIQQDEEDQELAFQHAFTMEALVTAIVGVVLLL